MFFTTLYSALQSRYYPHQINEEVEIQQDYTNHPVILVAKPTYDPNIHTLNHVAGGTLLHPGLWHYAQTSLLSTPLFHHLKRGKKKFDIFQEPGQLQPHRRSGRFENPRESSE